MVAGMRGGGQQSVHGNHQGCVWGAVAVLFMVISAGTAGAQLPLPALEGHWQGVLEVGATRLRLAFHLTRGADGIRQGTMDSLDQGARGIPVEEVEVEGDRVTLHVRSIGGTFSGSRSGSGTELVGEWRQGGVVLPLRLQRTEKPPVLLRPQEPRPPYPYRSEEVRYPSRESGVTLAGTLTLPRGKGPFPAVLLITGSGAQDRDEALMGHRPFLVLADALTRRGIAVLRVDDRGVGGSTASPEAVANATSLHYSRDVEGGLAYLRGRKEVHARRIGLIGHSEGGIIAPMVAARDPGVAFIVLLAGTGVPGEQILFRQAELINRAAGSPEAAVAANRRAQQELFTIVRSTPERALLRERLEAALQRLASPQVQAPGAEASPPAQRAALAPELVAQLRMLESPWFRYFLDYDPRPVLRKVRCPVLALNGGLDLQVPAEENLREIRTALRSGGNRRVTTRRFSGLNHLFQPARTGLPGEYGEIETTMDPAVLREIGDWILQQTTSGASAAASKTRRGKSRQATRGTARTAGRR
jgi:pimeloyl-ACP methyl ester carboxylesterase